MLRYLSRASLRRQRIVVRVDLNLPIAHREVQDDYDMIRVLPTLRRLLRAENVCILISHHSNEAQTLAPVAALLQERLGRPIAFLRDPSHRSARVAVEQARAGSVFLLENVRCWPGEKKNSPSFARMLAAFGQAFVNDAFGELHRPYASVVGLPRLLPSYAGLLVQTELKVLGRLRHRPRRPLVVVVGGAKVETKLAMVEKFLRRADCLLLAGVPAVLLLRARDNFDATARRLPPAVASTLRRILRSPLRGKMVLPADAMLAGAGHPRTVLKRIDTVRADEQMLDIGPQTVERFRPYLVAGRTILWNGPLGRVERKRFAAGTRSIVRIIQDCRAYRVAGGGDSVAFLRREKLEKSFDYLSSGGGAMLAYLAGEALPGLEALEESARQKPQRG